nr:lysosomal beta glucosidase-like [Ipomoea batatas]
MTLEEKIGQMTQLDRQNLTAAVLRDYSIGSVLGIPMIYGSDAVHGNNNVYKATIFPHNIGLGATRDAELVRRIGAATALEARATGIPYVFGPCVSVCRDPRWGRCYETFSEEVEIVREMTSEIVGGLQGDIPPSYRKGVPFVGGKTKVAACARNFVGDGGTTKGKDENDTVIGWHDLLSIHMPGFYHSIINGISTIALSYNTFNGQKLHADRTTILTGITQVVDPETKVVYNENPGIEFMKSNNFSNAIVVVGEFPYVEYYGDSLNLTIPEPGLTIVSNVCLIMKCVVVLVSGRPLVIEPYLPLIDALVAAWLPGTEGGGVADVLFGDYPFTGKLPRTWFKNVEQLPMNVGDPHYDPLFPFGFGLTTKV